MDMLDRCILNTCAIAMRRDEAPGAHKRVPFVAVVVGLETAWCADGRVKIAAVRLEALPGVVPKVGVVPEDEASAPAGRRARNTKPRRRPRSPGTTSYHGA